MTRGGVATLAMCLCAGCPAAGAELLNLDDFIGGIEKADGDNACKVSAPVDDFWGELIRRYFPYPNELRSTKVKLPAQFAAAFGKAVAEKREQEGLNRVQVPLAGTYRDLRVRQIAFDSGIENGISIVYILFDASKQEVESVLGSDLARATPMSWGSAKIVSRANGTELVCDRSS